MLTVMVVTREPDLADDIERLVEAGGFALGDRVTPDMLEEKKGTITADAAIVVGPLRSREGSDIRLAREALGEMRIVACAPPVDPRTLRWAVDNGADGVVWDVRMDQALVATLQCVCAGQLVVPRGARRQLQPPELTTREKQVLSLVVMGLSNGEIARKLFLTESTVKSHLGTAFRKLGVRSRAEAARLVADPEHGFGTGILAITTPANAGAARPNS